jgi:hypothetical protein
VSRRFVAAISARVEEELARPRKFKACGADDCVHRDVDHDRIIHTQDLTLRCAANRLPCPESAARPDSIASRWTTRTFVSSNAFGRGPTSGSIKLLSAAEFAVALAVR